MLRPTVSPIATDMSCNAVWNPERYELDAPADCCDANWSSPPLDRPDGTWKRIPVIYIIHAMLTPHESGYPLSVTDHDNEGITTEEAAIDV
jgi:hypothetical protein